MHSASLHRHSHAASRVLGLNIEHPWDLLLRRASSIPSTRNSSAFSEVFASSLQTPQAAVVSIFVFGLSRATWLESPDDTEADTCQLRKESQGNSTCLRRSSTDKQRDL